MGTMFEHLDDPEGVMPGRRELAGILSRADSIRSRHRWTLAVGSCCVLLAASIGFFLGRPSGQPALSTTDYQFNLEKGPLPIGLPVPTTALVDVQFATPQNGFALAVHDGDVLLASSTDGGSTWQVRNNHPPAAGAVGNQSLKQMEFVGSTGYLWGTSSAGAGPLWVTRDGGSSWALAPIGSDVVDVSAIDTDVWALSETSCAASGTSTSCPVTIDQSLDSGSTWTAVGQVPGGITFPTSPTQVAPLVELARITKTRAYVLTYGPQAAAFGWGMEFTADAGSTWLPRPVPCSGPDSLDAELAASSTTDLWLLCNGPFSAGTQQKELYRSSDGGLSWHVTASTPGGSTAAVGSLLAEGYVEPPGHHNLAVASPTTAWLYVLRAGLFKTTDAGVSWNPVASLESAGFPSGGFGNITFLSPTDGWICSYGVGLWHTIDGTTWQPLGAK
jgi:photosystem II stability/assembly factor-like uncharacterized protein